jgi:hypothetical protein
VSTTQLVVLQGRLKASLFVLALAVFMALAMLALRAEPAAAQTCPPGSSPVLIPNFGVVCAQVVSAPPVPTQAPGGPGAVCPPGAFCAIQGGAAPAQSGPAAAPPPVQAAPPQQQPAAAVPPPAPPPAAPQPSVPMSGPGTGGGNPALNAPAPVTQPATAAPPAATPPPPAPTQVPAPVASQPVTQPVSQPVTQPATQPVSQPVSQPVTQPVTVQPRPPAATGGVSQLPPRVGHGSGAQDAGLTAGLPVLLAALFIGSGFALRRRRAS